MKTVREDNMQIHEVESITRLTKKSIRYYEEEGLLNPGRNAFNDYREYTEEDIKVLRLIKFLRELNVPIVEIKKLKNNTLSLEECMRERIKKIEKEESNYETIKNMCIEILNRRECYDSIDITKYSKTINVLHKEGFTMKKKNKSHKEKIMGAVISSLLFSAIFIFLIGLISYFEFSGDDRIPWLIYIVLMLILLMPILGMIVNLIKRIKEIRGGEEDEALKY